VAYSHQVVDLPEVRAVTVQHDRYRVACGCGRVHVAGAPPEAAGVPWTVTYGLDLQAWCVFLLVMHYIPVQQCADLVESLTGTRPSDGWVHGLLARAAALAAGANKVIRALVIAARVICGDETPLRAGPGPKWRKKFLQVACRNLLTCYFLGERGLASFRDFIYDDLHGIVVVHDRYQNYDTFTGISHQLCCAHLLRDLEAAAQAHRDQAWPGKAAAALRALIHAANTARAQGLDRVPAAMTSRALRQFRHSITAGQAGVPRLPGSKRKQPPRPAAAGMPARPRSRRAPLPHRYRHPAHLQPGRTRSAPVQDPAEDLRPPPLPAGHPRPLRHPRLRLHRRQARHQRAHRDQERPRRNPVDTARPRPRLNPAHTPSPTATDR
jgi:transposase